MAAGDQAHHLRCGWHEAGGRGLRRANSQRHHVVNPDWASVWVSSMASSAQGTAARLRSCICPGLRSDVVPDCGSHILGRTVSRLCKQMVCASR